MLEELGGDVFVDPVVLRELQRDAHQVERVHRHPARAISLVDVSAGRQLTAAVEYADVVEPQKAALEDVAPLGILAVYPPGEIEHELVEHTLEEHEIALITALLAVDLEHSPRSPRVHRRVDIAEGPLVSRDLAVWVHVPLARQQHELRLGELGIEMRERNAVKRQIPGGVPRVLPFVRHRNDVGVVEVLPVAVAAVTPLWRRRRLRGITAQPLGDVEVEELLAPDHAGERLPLHEPCILALHAVLQVRVELVGFPTAQAEERVEVAEGLAASPPPQAKSDLSLAASWHLLRIPGRDLGAAPRGIDGSRIPVHDALVDTILEVTWLPRLIPQAVAVRLVLTEQQLEWISVGVQIVDAKARVFCAHEPCGHLLQRGTPHAGFPAPGIAKPK